MDFAGYVESQGPGATQRQQTSMLTGAKILFMTSLESPNGLILEIVCRISW